MTALVLNKYIIDVGNSFSLFRISLVLYYRATIFISFFAFYNNLFAKNDKSHLVIFLNNRRII